MENEDRPKLTELDSELAKMNPSQQWMILEELCKSFVPVLNKNENTLSGNTY